MRLIALVEGPDHVCCRYRLAAFRPMLERAGHTLELRAFPRRTWDWLRLVRELKAADSVIVQRRLLAGWQRRLVRRAARLLFFDFDDAVFFRDSYAARGFFSLRRLRRFTALIQAADVVVAGNPFLGDQAAGWIGRERIRVIPTCVHPTRYPRAEHRASGPGARLVWIGSASTLHGLERVRPLLEEVGRRCPGVSLKLVSDASLQFRHLPVVPCPWSEAAEGEALATADIGISWIPDDLWSRGKCGLKVLQYMAAGLPVVANPVGVQAELIRPGETGFLAETPDQWAEAVGRLAGDPALRRRLGAAGRRLVETAYSVERGAEQWLRMLDDVGQRRKSA